MLKRLSYLILVMLLSVTVLHAQDAPRVVVEAAIAAANRAIPTLGRPASWSWQLLGETRSSNLGCPLAQGTDLGRGVTPYKITLVYTSGSYVVHVSVDGTLTQPCDAKFGTSAAAGTAVTCTITTALTAVTVRSAPDANSTVVNANPFTNGSGTATRRTADGAWYEVRLPDSTVGWIASTGINAAPECQGLVVVTVSGGGVTGGASTCGLAPKNATTTIRQIPDFNGIALTDTAFTNNAATAIGRTSDNLWYQVRTLNGSIGWIYAQDVNTTGNCAAMPITAANDPNAVRSACYISPADAFSNVREKPNTDAKQVDQIFEGSSWQVFGRNTEGTWYFINPGWVAGTVVTTSGDCSRIPLTDNAIGTGSASPSLIGASFECPPGFEGYMPPRLSIGAARAQVAPGNIPNRIRTEPSVNGQFLTDAQPGRTFDDVLDGPACSGTYVWWLVELDGVVGWTAESDANIQEYFLIPLSPAGTPANTVITVPAQPTPGTDTATGGTPFLTLPIENSAGIAFNADSTGLFVLAPDEDSTIISLWSIPAGEQAGAVEVADAFAQQVLLNPDGDVVFITLPFNTGAATPVRGTLFTLAADTLAQGATFINLPPTGIVDFNSDGSFFVTTGCANANEDPAGCTRGQVELWNAVEGVPVRLQPAHPTIPFGALFSPDDSLIASVGVDGIQLWNTQTGAFVNAFANDKITGNVLFSSDGTKLIYAVCAVRSEQTCSQGDVIIQDSATGNVVLTLTGHTNQIQQLALSADGKQIASASLDGTVKLWDAATGTLIQTFNASPQGVNYVAFSPDGTLLAASTRDGTVIIWQIGGSVG
jgi:hypothetical protein